MAGLDGIKTKVEPPEPIDKDLYELPPDEHARLKQVLDSLPAVLDALERDQDYLLEGNVFTPDPTRCARTRTSSSSTSTSDLGPSGAV